MAIKSAKIGADPEFAFKKDGEMVYASDLVISSSGEFGTDGCPDIAELRPKAAWSATGLVESIRKTIEKEVARNKKLLDYEWHAGPCFKGHGLGGHIHFGMPFSMDFLNMLDSALAIPMMRCDDPVEARSRKRSYGRLSDYERKPWGFEYRSLSTWLSSEKKALAVLTVAQVLLHLFLNDRPKFDALFLNIGGRLTPEEFVQYRRHVLRPFAARTTAVLRELEILCAEPDSYAVNKTTKKGLREFIKMVRRPNRAEKVMKWKMNDKTLNAAWEQVAKEKAEAEAAAAAVVAEREARVAGVQFDATYTPEQALRHPVVHTPVTIRSLSVCSSDYRMNDLFRTMAGLSDTTTPRSMATSGHRDVPTYVFGVRPEREFQVMVGLGFQITTEQRAQVMMVVEHLKANGFKVEVGVPQTSSLSIGLRRDIREVLTYSRAIVASLMLAVNLRITNGEAI